MRVRWHQPDVVEVGEGGPAFVARTRAEQEQRSSKDGCADQGVVAIIVGVPDEGHRHALGRVGDVCGWRHRPCRGAGAGSRRPESAAARTAPAGPGSDPRRPAPARARAQKTPFCSPAHHGAGGQGSHRNWTCASATARARRVRAWRVRGDRVQKPVSKAPTSRSSFRSTTRKNPARLRAGAAGEAAPVRLDLRPVALRERLARPAPSRSARDRSRAPARCTRVIGQPNYGTAMKRGILEARRPLRHLRRDRSTRHRVLRARAGSLERSDASSSSGRRPWSGRTISVRVPARRHAGL